MSPERRDRIATAVPAGDATAVLVLTLQGKLAGATVFPPSSKTSALPQLPPKTIVVQRDVLYMAMSKDIVAMFVRLPSLLSFCAKED